MVIAKTSKPKVTTQTELSSTTESDIPMGKMTLGVPLASVLIQMEEAAVLTQSLDSRTGFVL